MVDEFKALIAKAASGAVLSRDEAATAFDRMMSGEATPSPPCWMRDSLPCMSLGARTTLPPKAWPIA